MKEILVGLTDDWEVGDVIEYHDGQYEVMEINMVDQCAVLELID